MEQSSSSARRLSLPAQVGLVAVAAVALVLALVVAPAALRAAAARPEPQAETPPPGTFRATPEQWRTFGFAPATRTDFAAEISTDGKIATDDDVTVQVTPPFSGRVIDVRVKAGDRVAKGQAMLTADAAEAAQVRSDAATAQANLAAARVQLATAEANAARQQALFKISGAALKDVQQSSGDLAAAEGAVRGDVAALAAARGRMAILGVTAAATSGGSAGLGALASLQAPISGVVILRAVGPGQYLNATSNGATTPIFTVSDLSRVWLVANVREEDAARMRVGLPVQVRVAGLPGSRFDARLDYVAPTLDPVTRRLPVRAVVANPQGLLKPEMYADFAIADGAPQMQVGVPASAVIYEGDTARVWVAHADRTLGLRQVSAGRTQDGQVEITSGLQPGERVVTSGAIFIDRAAKAG